MSALAHEALDVRLMRTLRILLTESSVSRTADILQLSQSSVSTTLRRLRELLDDPLLVRSGSRLVPTERGETILESVCRILDDMDAHLAPRDEFDPRRTEQRFSILTSNCLDTLLIPRLVARLRTGAPRATLEVKPLLEAEELMHRLEAHPIDMVISNWPERPENLRSAPLASVDIVCLMRRSHPFAGQRLSLETYLELDHVSPACLHNTMMLPIDGRLLQLQRKRRIAVSLPDYSCVPYLLNQTDLVFTTGRSFAEQLTRTLPLCVAEAPAELGRMRFYMLWHERQHASPSSRWLREQLRSVALDLARGAAVQPSGAPVGAIGVGE